MITSSVFALGNNTRGKLGSVCTTQDVISEPAQISAVKHVISNSETNLRRTVGERPIKQVAVGNEHTIFLTQDGKVFSVGVNCKSQLGLHAETPVVTVALEVEPSSYRHRLVKAVAAGGDRSFLLTYDNLVFACGDNAGGILGIGSAKLGKVSKFTLVQQPKAMKNCSIQEIVCGHNHTFLLTTDKRTKKQRVFVFGDNTCGQLGLNDVVKRMQPTELKLDFLENGMKIHKIVLGEKRSAIITDQQTLYLCGARTLPDNALASPATTLTSDDTRSYYNSTMGQYNTITNHTCVGTFTQVVQLDEVLSIAFARDYSIILTSSAVYRCGDMYSYLGAYPQPVSQWVAQWAVPTAVNYDPSPIQDADELRPLKNIYCTDFMTLFLTCSNRLFFTGALNVSMTDVYSLEYPVFKATQVENQILEIPTSMLPRDKELVSISTGKAHAVILFAGPTKGVQSTLDNLRRVIVNKEHVFTDVIFQ